jgi:mono/diheme cytochrome c family protein
MALAFTFALPVFNLLYVFTSPDVVFDNTVYGIAVANVFVCMLVAFAMLASLRAPAPRYNAVAFVMVLAVFVLSSTYDVRAMANANREHAVLLEQQAEKERLEREAHIDQLIAEASGANVGEETFNKVCMQCHRFNEKLVGPALAAKLPSYNLETLKAFIANPVKKDPAFPPMPNPGLNTVQIEAVAKYVLENYQGGGAAGGAPGAPTDSTAAQPTTSQPGVQH